MIVIKHLAGPLADTENEICRGVDRIVFGRNIDCEVVYPPDETNVSRHHFALVRTASAIGQSSYSRADPLWRSMASRPIRGEGIRWFHH